MSNGAVSFSAIRPSHHEQGAPDHMGKMIMMRKRDGWQVWPTPFWYRVRGAQMFKRWSFKGTRYAHNRRRKPIRHS